MLSKLRTKYRRMLIVIEDVYSMDGDIPDVHEMIRIKKKYNDLLFIDEAHSFGTMGATGRGICEHFNADPKVSMYVWQGFRVSRWLHPWLANAYQVPKALRWWLRVLSWLGSWLRLSCVEIY